MQKYKFLTGGMLKWIAIVTMFIDHFAEIFVYVLPSPKYYLILRTIGRLAFPIFCFLLVEGFLHTKNIKKYVIRLGIFSFISEIPFNLAVSGRYLFASHQNVFFTLWIGLIVLIFLKKYKEDVVIEIIAIFIGCFLATFLKTDYEAIGILIIVSFYLLREKKIVLTITMVLLNGLSNIIQLAGALALIPIFFYNGKRGRQPKYFFYAFYPIHLFLLYFVYTHWFKY